MYYSKKKHFFCIFMHSISLLHKINFAMKTVLTKNRCSYTSVAFFCTLLVSILLTHISAYAVVRYVKPTNTGLGDGSSWANASGNLQAMIYASAAGDEVWVASGTYKPDTYPAGCNGCSSPLDYTFHLQNMVKLYGGFAGTETLLNERDITANETILSGDFNGDDVITGSGNTLSITGNNENARHVVITVSDNADTVFDGFTVKGGKALNSGTGIFVEMENIHVGGGGGMYNKLSSLTINNISFIGNSATLWGGGMFNTYSSTIANTTFTNNQSGLYGGGMYNHHAPSTITNTTFSGNRASDGCGMYNLYFSNHIITNATFTGNYGGYVIYNSESSAFIINATFTANWANIILNYYSFSTIINSTFTGNFGIAIRNIYLGSTIQNCILWNNSTEIVNESASLTTVNYSIIQGGYPGTGNIDANPLFVNPDNPAGPDGIHRTADDGLRLQPNSPAINAGDNSVVTDTTDIIGLDRIQFGFVDIGAYEYGYFTGLPHVSPSATPANLAIYPNPTNNTAIITLTLPNEEAVTLSVYNLEGKEVAVLFNGMTEANKTYQLVFNTQDLPASTYYAVLRKAEGSQQSMPVLVVK